MKKATIILSSLAASAAFFFGGMAYTMRNVSIAYSDKGSNMLSYRIGGMVEYYYIDPSEHDPACTESTPCADCLGED